MIRVLQIGLTNNKGGIESFILNYSKTLKEKNIVFDFIKSYNILQYEKEFKESGSKIYKTCNFNRNPIKYYFQLYRIIKKNKYDIIHYNMNSCVNILPLIAGKMARCKLIIAHAHNSSNDKGMLKEALHQFNRPLLNKFANVFLSCSDKASDWFYSKNISRKKIIKIPNSIDYKKYEFNQSIRNKYRKMYNLENKFVIGHVGRFNKQKNHIYLLEVFEEIINRNSSAFLVLVGDGPEYKIIEKIVQNKNIENKVLFLQDRDDVCNLYQMFDIFVMPSLYEGLPVVGIEAQVAGLPCIFSSEVTRELTLSDNVKFISLECKDKWINQILKYTNSKRYVINNKRFDIYNSTEVLERIYTKK